MAKLKKLDKKKLKYLLKDEELASQYYKSIGLTGFSKDEARHAAFFRKQLEEVK